MILTHILPKRYATECIHTDRLRFCLDMCYPCYNVEYRKRNKAKILAINRNKKEKWKN